MRADPDTLRAELPVLRPPAVQGDARTGGNWAAEFAPSALALDGFGTLFALDASTDRIYRCDLSGRWIRFGAGAQGGGRFASLRALDVRGPDLYALDSADGAFYRFGLDGRLRTRILLRNEELGTIDAVDFVVDKAGELWVLDRAGNRLLRFGRNGEFLADLAEGAAGGERLSSPTKLALEPSGGVFVLEPGRRRVRRFSRQGELLAGWSYDRRTSGQPDSRADMGSVVDLLVTETEVILVDGGGRWVRSYSLVGSPVTELPLSGSPIAAAALSTDGVLHLAHPDAGEITRIRWKMGQDDGAPGVR